MGNRRLSPQQLLFVDEYLRTSNATQSYIFAYYTSYQKPEPKNAIARSRASQLLTSRNISEQIELKRQEIAKQNGVIDPAELMQIWTGLWRMDPNEMFTASGDLKPMNEIPLPIRLAISRISTHENIVEKADGSEVCRNTRTDFFLMDKHQALNNIADVYGIRKNGSAAAMRDFLQASGVNITINQTINNDNRTLNYNSNPLQKMIETDAQAA